MAWPATACMDSCPGVCEFRILDNTYYYSNEYDWGVHTQRPWFYAIPGEDSSIENAIAQGQIFLEDGQNLNYHFDTATRPIQCNPDSGIAESLGIWCLHVPPALGMGMGPTAWTYWLGGWYCEDTPTITYNGQTFQPDLSYEKTGCFLYEYDVGATCCQDGFADNFWGNYVFWTNPDCEPNEFCPDESWNQIYTMIPNPYFACNYLGNPGTPLRNACDDWILDQVAYSTCVYYEEVEDSVQVLSQVYNITDYEWDYSITDWINPLTCSAVYLGENYNTMISPDNFSFHFGTSPGSGVDDNLYYEHPVYYTGFGMDDPPAGDWYVFGPSSSAITSYIDFDFVCRFWPSGRGIGDYIQTTSATVGINIEIVDDPPVASDSTQTVIEDTTTPLIFDCTDPETFNNPGIIIQSGPLYGTVEGDFEANGRLDYTPNLNYNGQDVIVFKCDDGVNPPSDVATLTINVSAVEDLPFTYSIGVFGETDSYIYVDEGSSDNEIQVTCTDEDDDYIEYYFATIGTGYYSDEGTNWAPGEPDGGYGYHTLAGSTAVWASPVESILVPGQIVSLDGIMLYTQNDFCEGNEDHESYFGANSCNFGLVAFRCRSGESGNYQDSIGTIAGDGSGDYLSEENGFDINTGFVYIGFNQTNDPPFIDHIWNLDGDYYSAMPARFLLENDPDIYVTGQCDTTIGGTWQWFDEDGDLSTDGYYCSNFTPIVVTQPGGEFDEITLSINYDTPTGNSAGILEAWFTNDQVNPHNNYGESVLYSDGPWYLAIKLKPDGSGEDTQVGVTATDTGGLSHTEFVSVVIVGKLDYPVIPYQQLEMSNYNGGSATDDTHNWNIPTQTLDNINEMEIYLPCGIGDDVPTHIIIYHPDNMGSVGEGVFELENLSGDFYQWGDGDIPKTYECNPDFELCNTDYSCTGLDEHYYWHCRLPENNEDIPTSTNYREFPLGYDGDLYALLDTTWDEEFPNPGKWHVPDREYDGDESYADLYAFAKITIKPNFFWYGNETIYWTCFTKYEIEDLNYNWTWPESPHPPMEDSPGYLDQIFPSGNGPYPTYKNTELQYFNSTGVDIGPQAIAGTPRFTYDRFLYTTIDVKPVKWARWTFNALYEEHLDGFGFEIPGLCTTQDDDSGLPFCVTQTHLDNYDPYRGIDLPLIEDTINCQYLEFMLESTAPGPEEDSYGDDIWYNALDYPFLDVSTYDCSTDFSTTGDISPISKIRAKCSDGSNSTLCDSGGVGTNACEAQDWVIYTGEDACSVTMNYSNTINTNVYFSQDEDKRPSLGIFYSDDENQLENQFIKNVSDFEQSDITNLMSNPTGRQVEGKYNLWPIEATPSAPWWGTSDNNNITWTSIQDIDFKFSPIDATDFYNEDETSLISIYLDVLYGQDIWRNNHIEIVDDETITTPGAYCFQGVGETISEDDISRNLCNGAYRPAGGWEYMNFSPIPSAINFAYPYDSDYFYAGEMGYIHPFHPNMQNSTPLHDGYGNSDTQLFWAHWTHSNHCHSYGRCLAFVANGIDHGGSDDTTGQYLDPAHWTATESYVGGGLIPHYATLNQYQNIYYAPRASPKLLPGATLKVSFWMKTLPFGDGYAQASDGSTMPEIEVAITPIHPGLGDISTLIDSPELLYNNPNYYNPLGRTSSLVNHRNNVVVQGEPAGNSSGRFYNNIVDKWEQFEFTFTLNETHYDSDNARVGNLYFTVQWGNDASAAVFLDDFSVTESFDFEPDVDVRKRKGPGSYGIDTLTKYYDPEIDFDKYQDTTAPLEAQFYFYPRYDFNELFGIDKPILHNDFSFGMFYLFDVDWGDGSPKEFTSEPEELGNNKMIYHTYKKSGIYEVTGYMLRMRPDENYEPIGIVHNKRFTVRINVNEGLDEDFTYFGTDGFSFVPYKNVLPIIGGTSEQSMYYKSIKRQLGFITDDINVSIDFKKESDKLKTELALLKMTGEFKDDFEILPEFQIPRNSSADDSGDDIWTGNLYLANEEELGYSIGDTDITNIRYFNQPKSMWEMLGFTDEQSRIPTNIRYWKNIIPEFILFTDREGIDLDAIPPNPIIDVESEQEWFWSGADSEVIICNSGGNTCDTPPASGDFIYYSGNAACDSIGLQCEYLKAMFTSSGQDGDDIFYNVDEYPFNDAILDYNCDTDFSAGYISNISELVAVCAMNQYYPVLPRYDKFGEWIYDYENEQYDYPYNNIPFPLTGPITDKELNDDSLIIDITANQVETNVLDDGSGNQNYGFAYSDYRPKFDDKTFELKQVKNTNRIRVSKNNGAF